MKQTLKPAPGRLVRKADGESLKPEGETVVLDLFWRRRLSDGDVVPAKAARKD